MRFVEWCRLFETKKEEINRQHRELFDITNRFHEEFLSYHDTVYKGIRKDKADRLFLNTLNKLIKYAQEHFTNEEELLISSKAA